MGKTYRITDELDYLDGMFEDDPDLDLDLEDDIDLYLTRQASNSSSKNKKGGRAGKRRSAHDEANAHRLPSDWQDFDYGPDMHIPDDWR